jgi:hypothetical protein
MICEQNRLQATLYNREKDRKKISPLKTVGASFMTHEQVYTYPSTSGISSRRLLFLILLTILVRVIIGLAMFREIKYVRNVNRIATTSIVAMLTPLAIFKL